MPETWSKSCGSQTLSRPKYHFWGAKQLASNSIHPIWIWFPMSVCLSSQKEFKAACGTELGIKRTKKKGRFGVEFLSSPPVVWKWCLHLILIWPLVENPKAAFSACFSLSLEKSSDKRQGSFPKEFLKRHFLCFSKHTFNLCWFDSEMVFDLIPKWSFKKISHIVLMCCSSRTQPKIDLAVTYSSLRITFGKSKWLLTRKRRH